jgi:hypothetical protein
MSLVDLCVHFCRIEAGHAEHHVSDLAVSGLLSFRCPSVRSHPFDEAAVAEQGIKRHAGPETFSALNVRPDPQVVSSWRNLIVSLEGLPRAEQLSKIVEYLSKIRDMDQKGVVLQAFGLPKAFANLSTKELADQLARIKQILTPMSDTEVAAGRAFADAMDDVALAFRNLRDVIGGDLARDLRGVADSMTEFTKEHSQDIVEGFRDLAQWVKSADWAAVGADLRAFATGANNVAQALGGWKPILEFLAAYQVAKILGITAAVRGLAGAFGMLGAVATPPGWILGLLGGAGAVMADKDRQKRGDKGPGGLYGTPLLGFDPVTGAPIEMPQGNKEHGDAGPTGGIGNLPSGMAPERPLWRRLFEGINKEGGLLGKTAFDPAGYKVEGGGRNPLLAGAGDVRGAVAIIHDGTLAALKDFAADQNAGGGGGGGAGAGIGAIRANGQTARRAHGS